MEEGSGEEAPGFAGLVGGLHDAGGGDAIGEELHHEHRTEETTEEDGEAGGLTDEPEIEAGFRDFFVKGLGRSGLHFLHALVASPERAGSEEEEENGANPNAL